MTRGRKSQAEKILQELKNEPETENVYLVTYDFVQDKAHHRFWSNLKNIINGVGGERVHYSVYCGDRRGAKAIRELASSYGADVRWFVAIELR